MRYLDTLLFPLILLSAFLMVLESLPELQEHVVFFVVIDMLVWLAFLAEYAMRIARAGSRRAYLLSFYGIVDLLAILPWFIFIAFSILNALQLPWVEFGVLDLGFLNLFRILRLLKLLRYTEATQRFQDALQEIGDELLLFFGAAAALTLFFSLLIYEAEYQAQPEHFSSVPATIWWVALSLIAGEHVDVQPVTTIGRLLSLAMLLTGVGIVAVPTALLASALSKKRGDPEE